MKIALDIDGVISDFKMKTETKEEWQKKFPHFVQDGGFLKLPVKEGAYELVEFLEMCLELGVIEDVFYLSSAGGIDPEHLAEITEQKIQWLQNNEFPDWTPVVVHRKGLKKLWAKEGTILIDDQECNVQDFLDAGGDAIPYRNAAITMDVLKLLLWDEMVGKFYG